MKKNLWRFGISLLLTLLFLNGAAQLSSSYVYVKPMYGFSGNETKLSENSVAVQGITYTKGLYGSFAQGLSIQIGIGKMINPNFGFEMAAEWVNGKKLKSNLQVDDQTRGSGAERIRSFLLKPMITFRSSGDLLAFYSKLGPAISVYSKHTADADVYLNISGQDVQATVSQTDKIKVKVGVGGAFGISFRILQSMALTTELSGQMMSLSYKNGQYTKFLRNGRDQLSSFTTSQKSWVYETFISTATPDPAKPSIKLLEPANFSYVGVSIGLHYYL